MRKKKRKSSKKPSSIYFLIKSIFLFGVLLIVVSLLYNFHLINRLSFSKNIPPVPVVATYSRSSLSTNIKIAKVNIDLPIYETSIVNGTWEIANDGASHLSISARPGENSTIIIYSHNTVDRFGPIRWLTIGNSIDLTSSDNNIYSYVITDIVEVNSDQTDMLTSQKDETLILYTCSGFADQKRYIVISKPVASSAL